MTRALFITMLCALCACEEDKGSEQPGDAAGNGAGQGDGGMTLPPEIDDLINGPQDEASLQERYATRCEPHAMTLSGTLGGESFEESFSPHVNFTNLGSITRSFGQQGRLITRFDTMDPLTMGPIQLFQIYPVTAQIVMPLDSAQPMSVVCAGEGSTFQRTPLEEVVSLEGVSVHACPGEALPDELDACIVAGLDDELCQPEGLVGTLDGTMLDGTGVDSYLGSQNTLRVELFGGLTLAVQYEGEGQGPITRGLLISTGGRLGPATYCLGDGSSYLREEMDFSDRITLELRGLSKLPSCEDAEGDDSLTACFRR